MLSTHQGQFQAAWSLESQWDSDISDIDEDEDEDTYVWEAGSRQCS